MRTLYRQFIITTVLIMALSAIAGYLLTNMFYHSFMKEKNDAKNVSIATEIANYIENADQLDLAHYLEGIGEVGYQLYVIREDGKEQFYGGHFKRNNLSDAGKETVFSGNIYHGMRDFPHNSFMTAFFSNELKNSVGVPFTFDGEEYGLFLRPNINLLFSEVHVILAGLITSMAVISLISMLFVAKQLIKPITQLTDATKQITKGDYGLRLSINRSDEIGQLAHSFNQMTEQLKETDQSRKEFISNVSHDFQSPLLNIQGYANLLQSADVNEKERLKFASIIESETKRLSNLTKQLLLLTSLDQSTRTLRRTSFSLDQQIKRLSRSYLWLLEDLDIDLYYKSASIQCYGDEDLLEAVWDNLIVNALKYNKPNGSLEITITETAEDIIVKFKDSGIGLKEEEIPHLFERFYRADSSRTAEGTGLGLAIAKQIIDVHGGKIEVESTLGEGTTFIVTLPKKPES
ncbi:MAG: sensor histidine kinase [Bacillus sp. (in: firmicutes)]